MNINKKLLAVCIAVPLAVGGIAALLTGGGMQTFESLNQPPLSPPGWLFPVVWTILYALMGAASYLVLTSGAASGDINRAINRYALQLAINFLWPVFFFGLSAYWFAFAWLIALWGAILAAVMTFRRVSATAAWMLLPYLLWVTFAGYLNIGIAILN